MQKTTKGQTALPNGCFCSEISVHPAGWNKAGASVKGDWYLQYYFHDPKYKHIAKYKYGRLCIVKGGVNRLKTLEERREVIRALLEDEWRALLELGYNPHTGRYDTPVEVTGEINSNTTFIKALRLAMDKMNVKEHTLIDVRSTITYVEKASISLGIERIQISQVRRRHIRQILDTCAKIKKYWSGHIYNHYRAYLMSLFKILVEHEAVDTNPVREISKVIVKEKLRSLLTAEERQIIDQHFLKSDPAYRRFLHVFFHSGARPVELIELRGTDADLTRQVYKVTVNKGGKIREEERPIKDNALAFWNDIISEIPADQLAEYYIFGKGLQPSKIKATRDYITKKWQREVKGTKKHAGLGIQKDLYSLKHLNLDETAEALTILEASKQAGHSSPVITMKHYAHGEKKRADDRLRGVNNKFAG